MLAKLTTELGEKGESTAAALGDRRPEENEAEGAAELEPKPVPMRLSPIGRATVVTSRAEQYRQLARDGKSCRDEPTEEDLERKNVGMGTALRSQSATHTAQSAHQRRSSKGRLRPIAPRSCRQSHRWSE
jgi:hypothetical protein